MISVLSAGLTLLAMVASAIHVVMYKRDIKSAIGWLGLIWFAPVLGIVMYWIFGINRIQRKAKTLFSGVEPVDLHSSQGALFPDNLQAQLGSQRDEIVNLARLSEQVTVNPLMYGNDFKPLVNGDEAYPAILRAIEQARHSVSLVTYIFDNDTWGHRFRKALADATARGVQVRVLVDDIGARYTFPSIVRGLKRDGVPVSRFMRSIKPWRFRYYNLRNHRKIIVVDGQNGFTGGMNIRCGNVVRENPDHPVQDLHFHVQGPVVAELQKAFAEDWKFTTGEELASEIWFPLLPVQGRAVARGISDGPDENYDKLKLVLLGALSCATSTVRIASPYFLPDQELTMALRVAALKGVEVEIFQPEVNNLKMVKWASSAYYQELLEDGCTIQLTPPPFDHSKIMVVDDIWVVLGSANWDPRSLQFNFEFNVEVYDSDLAQTINGILEAKRNLARTISLQEIRSRSMPVMFRDNIFRLASPYL
ncbi:MAG: cardiolipin synthase [Desulfovermiculus sp.]|nr:cardiolipin synthase [Desulfovermiculus sp.]